MTSTFLVVGATGNTGRAVVKTLSDIFQANNKFSDYKIIALTRSANGNAAQKLAALPLVEVQEQNWVDITADWLRQRNVVRAFIASHNEPSQFAQESTFHLAALNAGVEYVVRISTTAANVTPVSAAYYPRSHWAIEALLSSPEFERLQWTSLQPNVFFNFYLAPAIEYIKNFKKTGKRGTLAIMASEDAPVGVIDSDDVGIVAAHLLTADDVNVHNKAKYVLNGPEDITGRQVVALVEKYVGEKVENVKFKDMDFIEQAAAQAQEFQSLIQSIVHAPETAWDGKCSTSTTSKEVLELAAPKCTAVDFIEAALRNE